MSWKRFKAALAHAFAFDDGRGDIRPEDIALFDRVADFIVRRRMTTPALMILQSAEPLSFIGSSMMTFLRPIVGIVFNTTEYERFERLLEKRCALQLLIERIELRDRAKPDDTTDAKGDQADPTSSPPPTPSS